MPHPRRRRPSKPELERHIRDLASAHAWDHHLARAESLDRDGFVDGFPATVLVRSDQLVFVFTAPEHDGLSLPETRWADRLSRIDTVGTVTVRGGNLSGLSRLLRVGLVTASPGLLAGGPR